MAVQSLRFRAWQVQKKHHSIGNGARGAQLQLFRTSGGAGGPQSQGGGIIVPALVQKVMMPLLHKPHLEP